MIWCPKQMPYSGTSAERIRSTTSSIHGSHMDTFRRDPVMMTASASTGWSTTVPYP